MKRIRCGSPGRARGFTLVELLLVMGIIVLMVGLLMPAVNAAIVAARVAGTENLIANLSTGLESFRADWGIYPPSDASHPDAAIKYWNWNQGYSAIAYYLMGPTGTGWGANATPGTSCYRKSPFGGDASAAYGPYFKPEAGSSVTDSVLDAFKPGKRIYYYRYEPTGSSPYNVADCGAADSSLVNNFASQSPHFELLVRPKDPSTTGRRWVRTDYLLISSGADRLWGYMVEDSSGKPKAAEQTDIDNGQAVCDDVCNFKR